MDEKQLLCLCGEVAVVVGMCWACAEDLDRVADIFDRVDIDSKQNLHSSEEGELE
jgi:hypothetical protein